MLNIKDKRILYELDINSRQSASSLAKKVGISKQGCTYKIRRLFEKGILKSAVVILNTPRMGRLSFRMYFKLIDISPEKEDEFRLWLINHSLVPWLVGCEGVWDYILVVFPKDFEEFQYFSQELNHNWGDFIERKDIALVTEAHHFRAGYLFGEQVDLQSFVYGGQPKDLFNISDVDSKILSLLSANARADLVDIGKKLGFSAKNIAYHIRKLETANIIEGYTITVDYNKLGFERFKVFLRSKSMSKQKEAKFIEWARLNPYCLYWSKSIATSDIELEFIVKNSIHLRAVIVEMRRLFGNLIKSYDVVKILEEFKLNFIPWVKS